jgi:hypothetical protein
MSARLTRAHQGFLGGCGFVLSDRGTAPSEAGPERASQAVLGLVQVRQVAFRCFEANYFRVLRLQVEEIGLMRRRVPVADGVAHDERDEAVLAGIYCARAYTATGRDAGDQQRVDAERSQRRNKRRAKKCARVLLTDDRLAVDRLESLGKSRELGMQAALKAGQWWELAEEHAAVPAAGLVNDVCVDHRNTGLARGVQEPRTGLARGFDPCIEWRTRHQIGSDEIDHQQRGAAPGMEVLPK